METWYGPVILAALYLFLAASFIIPGIRLLKRIRSSGVSKGTHRSLVGNFTISMILCVAVTAYVTVNYSGEMVSYWVLSGLIGLMLIHLDGLRLYLKDEDKRVK